MTSKERIISILSNRGILYHVEFAQLFDVKTAVFLSQLLYWHGKGKYGDWQYHRLEQFTDETGLSARELDRCRETLKQSKVLEEQLHGVPPTIWFRLSLDQLEESLTSISTNGGFNYDKTSELITTKRRNQLPPNVVNNTETTNREYPESTFKKPTKKEVAHWGTNGGHALEVDDRTLAFAINYARKRGAKLYCNKCKTQEGFVHSCVGYRYVPYEHLATGGD